MPDAKKDAERLAQLEAEVAALKAKQPKPQPSFESRSAQFVSTWVRFTRCASKTLRTFRLGCATQSGAVSQMLIVQTSRALATLRRVPAAKV
jgi:hypothetical protein